MKRDIKCKVSIKALQDLPSIVKGDFDCAFCNYLKDLKGSPEIVEGNFVCYCCDNIETLDGAPEIVEGDFDCSYCKNLISVEHSPKKCKIFDCKGCDKLKTLDPLLRCDIEYVKADKHLLEDYNKKKKIIDKHGYERAMEVFDVLDNLL